MFLNHVSSAARPHHRNVMVVLHFLLTCAAQDAQCLPPCFVHVPVYDASGNRLQQFSVSSVTFEGAVGIDLRTISDPRYRVEVRHDKIYFHKELIGRRPLIVTLTSSQKNRLSGRIPLTACRLRRSLEAGPPLDSGLDVAWSTVTGHFSGCRFVGDWWVRAVPLFGSQEAARIHDGFVAGDGAFSLSSNFTGERHIIVVGRGKYPAKAFAADFREGSNTDVGTIDLRGSCPP